MKILIMYLFTRGLCWIWECEMFEGVFLVPHHSNLNLKLFCMKKERRGRNDIFNSFWHPSIQPSSLLDETEFLVFYEHCRLHGVLIFECSNNILCFVIFFRNEDEQHEENIFWIVQQFSKHSDEIALKWKMHGIIMRRVLCVILMFYESMWHRFLLLGFW